MNYKKYTNNAYNLHLIKTDKFKSILIKINFKRKVKKEDVTYRNLLSKALLQSTNKYKTSRELEIMTEELYGFYMNAESFLSGNYILTSFTANFLNEKYTEKGMNEKSLQFLLDFIFEPDVTNKSFNNFDIVKRLVKDEIETLKDNPKVYSQIRLLEEIDKKGPISLNGIGYTSDLEKIDSHKLYKYYESFLKSDLIDIFVVGNIGEEFKDLIVKNFNINTLKKPSESHFVKHDKLRKRVKIIYEEMPVEQAKLNIGFKLDNLTDFEMKYVTRIYSFILGGGPNSKLFKNVREKNSLCYYINCSYKPTYNLLVISAGINKEQFKKCLNLIKKELNKIKKGEFEESDINEAKTTFLNALQEIEDSALSIVKTFESCEYLGLDLIEDRKKTIVNVTKEDIMNFAKKVHIDTIYVLQGGQNEENN